MELCNHFLPLVDLCPCQSWGRWCPFLVRHIYRKHCWPLWLRLQTSHDAGLGRERPPDSSGRAGSSPVPGFACSPSLASPLLLWVVDHQGCSHNYSPVREKNRNLKFKRPVLPFNKGWAWESGENGSEIQVRASFARDMSANVDKCDNNWSFSLLPVGLVPGQLENYREFLTNCPNSPDLLWPRVSSGSLEASRIVIIQCCGKRTLFAMWQFGQLTSDIISVADPMSLVDHAWWLSLFLHRYSKMIWRKVVVHCPCGQPVSFKHHMLTTAIMVQHLPGGGYMLSWVMLSRKSPEMKIPNIG